MSVATSQSNIGLKHRTAIPEKPITMQYKDFPNEENSLHNNAVPRATIAATTEAPNGTQQDGWAEKENNRKRTVSQVSMYHVARTC